ncbi:uncharacterized protein BO97DRAFT_424150 [Aspergillus homomorphus CBS 101889]|uniref:NAD(P)-binding protein n=1 Tax=Aspergillus homomorphus (strain CBS 101889) TaxID=1450537 RepID=A0A395HZ58_ASPHC|nr:hypothetical protein BO97DRAFT_424150 [Aspergillus homomorphus CBS 101889]RAL12977.1 hypothetical protein BO97DRAFT_424150 [Aspergillus homomorphus CBS 101889]
MSSILGTVTDLESGEGFCSSFNITRQLALEYVPHRIHVNALCPGYTQTAIFKEGMAHMNTLEVMQRRHPFNGPGVPDAIARMAVVLVSEDAN